MLTNQTSVIPLVTPPDPKWQIDVNEYWRCPGAKQEQEVKSIRTKYIRQNEINFMSFISQLDYCSVLNIKTTPPSGFGGYCSVNIFLNPNTHTPFCVWFAVQMDFELLVIKCMLLYLCEPTLQKNDFRPYMIKMC